jgi:hypothetical protein
MKPLLLAVALALLPTTAHVAAAPQPGPPQPRPALTAFTSDAELAAYLRAHAPPRGPRRAGPDAAVPMAAPSVALQEVVVTGAAARTAESVTNVQHAGADEGGIVKVHGDHLVILRRGRLFTVSMGGGRLTPVDAVDAFPPGARPGGHLVRRDAHPRRDRVAVIGYSYRGAATEIGLFALDPGAGSPTSRPTISCARTTTTRRATTRAGWWAEPWSSTRRCQLLPDAGCATSSPVPAMPRSWRPARRTASRRAGRGPRGTVYRPGAAAGRHSVAAHRRPSAAWSGGELAASGAGCSGPGPRFYVSPGSVYVWVSEPWRVRADRGEPERRYLYRMPLDGRRPDGALGVHGMPGRPVLLPGERRPSPQRAGHGRRRRRGRDVGIGAEHGRDVALLRVPLGELRRRRPSRRRRSLPPAALAAGGAFHNRFVGDYLLYGAGSGGVTAAARWIARCLRGALAERRACPMCPLDHGVDRIEALGDRRHGRRQRRREICTSAASGCGAGPPW